MPDVKNTINGLQQAIDIMRRIMPNQYWFDIETPCNDAIALLKAQEPRLLELDEIKMFGLLWLESRNGFVQPVICQSYEYGVDKAVDFIMVHGTICNSADTFGKLWRVWTSEPSKEQREAMRWWNE